MTKILTLMETQDIFLVKTGRRDDGVGQVCHKCGEEIKERPYYSHRGKPERKYYHKECWESLFL